MLRSDFKKDQPMNRSMRPCALARVSRQSLALLALVAVVGPLLEGCRDAQNDLGAPYQSASEHEPSLEVQIVHPQQQEIRDSIVGTGTIAAAQTSNIGVAVAGIVERIFVGVGDRVEKGQALFQTRRNNYDIGVQMAAAEVAVAEARAAQARLDFGRTQELLHKGVISQAQLDVAASALKATKAQVAFAEAALLQAKQDLEDTIVRAPYEGVITARKVDEGTYRSEQTFSGDSSVIQLQKIDIVVAIVQVPEIHLAKLSLRTPAKLFVDGLDDVFDSEILIINDKVDPQTRTVEVRLPIANEDYRVKDGLFVRAELFPPARSVVLLDRRAVLGRPHDPHVFLLEDGTARKHSIALRDFDTTHVEIVSGLDSDAPVLAGVDLQRLADGDLVLLIDAAR